MPSRKVGGKPTSSDVAAAAGVSRSAVSFAFNSPQRISAATRERILAVAAELGYTPNTLARMLQAGTTTSIGVLLPQRLAQVMENPYYARFLMGVGQICDQEGYTLLLTPPLGDSVLKAIPYAAVDGFIVCGLETEGAEVVELERRGIPYVLVDSDRFENAASVEVDDRGGAHDVTRYLLELGHRRIALLSIGPGPDVATRGYRGPLGRRLTGIVDALSTAGLAMSDVALAEVPVSRYEGYRATKQLMASPGYSSRMRRQPVAGLRRARAASLLLLALPGSAYLYQGEELGLPEVVDLPPEVRQDPAFHRATGQDGSRDGCRVPIPWSGTEAPYGFGPAGAPTWLPQPASWAELSVEAQDGVPGATLTMYRDALALRRKVLHDEDLTWQDAPEGVLAFDRGDGLRCTVNMTAEPVRLDRPGDLLIASGPLTVADGAAVLPPDTTAWWSR